MHRLINFCFKIPVGIHLARFEKFVARKIIKLSYNKSGSGTDSGQMGFGAFDGYGGKHDEIEKEEKCNMTKWM